LLLVPAMMCSFGVGSPWMMVWLVGSGQ